MSGFFAIRSARGPVDRRAVEAIIATASHRGTPREWSENGIMMIALDGRRGSGLAVAEDFVVACDARIDNRAGNAAEVLLDAWRRNDLRSVIGDFAGAVWDRKRKQLSVFRDPCAGRAALLSVSATGALAATSLPMLLADPGIDREIDGAWVTVYLRGEGGFRRATGYTGIERLEPGSIAVVTDGAPIACGNVTTTWKQQKYFEFNFAPTRESDDAAYAERLRELLTEAVRCRIDGAQRIGVSLSGGLDSTSVAACAKQAAPEMQRIALSVPFTDAAADERTLQKLVADHLQMKVHWAPLGESPFGDSPDATLRALGAPPVAPNQFFIDAVAEAGAQERIEVALDGIDGDGMLGGNWFYLADLFATGRLRQAMKELDAAAKRHGVGRKPMFKAAVATPLKQDPGHIGRMFRNEERSSLSPGVLPAVIEAIDEQWARRGIEAAHPFLDRRVVEFCLGLPREQKIRLGFTKIALRNCMKPLLPAKVTERAEKAELGSSLLSAIHGQTFHLVETGLTLVASNPFPWVTSESAMRLAEQFRRGSNGVEAFRLAYLGFWRKWLEETNASRDRQAGVP